MTILIMFLSFFYFFIQNKIIISAIYKWIFSVCQSLLAQNNVKHKHHEPLYQGKYCSISSNVKVYANKINLF